MFCPQCRCEYRPGFHECADCALPLVEQLPEPAPPPKPDPEAVRWELDRRDSLNIAFIKGALVGMACAEVFAMVARLVVRKLNFPFPPFTPGATPPWIDIVYPLIELLLPLGIVIGGYVGRSRRL
jgi:hypothetical protein